MPQAHASSSSRKGYNSTPRYSSCSSLPSHPAAGGLPVSRKMENHAHTSLTDNVHTYVSAKGAFDDMYASFLETSRIYAARQLTISKHCYFSLSNGASLGHNVVVINRDVRPPSPAVSTFYSDSCPCLGLMETNRSYSVRSRHSNPRQLQPPEPRPARV